MGLIMNTKMQAAQCNGKFFFSPHRPGLKKLHRSFHNGIILKVDNSITDYYSWWLDRKFGVQLSKPAWGTHVTVVSDRDRLSSFDQFNLLKNKIDQKIIKIEHKVEVRKQWQFWILDVVPSDELISIRRALGLKENIPFHITIGRDDCV